MRGALGQDNYTEWNIENKSLLTWSLDTLWTLVQFTDNGMYDQQNCNWFIVFEFVYNLLINDTQRIWIYITTK